MGVYYLLSADLGSSTGQRLRTPAVVFVRGNNEEHVKAAPHIPLCQTPLCACGGLSAAHSSVRSLRCILGTCAGTNLQRMRRDTNVSVTFTFT